MFTKTKFFAIIFVMKQTNAPATGNGRSPKKSFLDQPRKAVSGMIYSGAIIGMLLISLVFSVTVAVLSRSLGMTVDEISQTQGYRYCSYLLYQIVYIGIIAAFMGIYKEKPAQFGWKKTHPKYYLIGIFLLFGLMFSLNYVNNWFVAFLGLFGYTMPESSLPSLAGGGIVGVLFVVAVYGCGVSFGRAFVLCLSSKPCTDGVSVYLRRGIYIAGDPRTVSASDGHDAFSEQCSHHSGCQI